MNATQLQIKEELDKNQRDLYESTQHDSMILQRILEQAMLDKFEFNRSQIKDRPCMLESSQMQNLSESVMQVSGDIDAALNLESDSESED